MADSRQVRDLFIEYLTRQLTAFRLPFWYVSCCFVQRSSAHDMRLSSFSIVLTLVAFDGEKEEVDRCKSTLQRLVRTVWSIAAFPFLVKHV